MKYITLDLPANVAPMIEYQTNLQATCRIECTTIEAVLLFSFICMRPHNKDTNGED